MDREGSDIEVFFYSPDAEAYVIGCLLTDPARTLEMADQMHVTPSWFFMPTWKATWESAEALRLEGHSIELPALCDMIRQRILSGNPLNALTQLMDEHNSPSNLLYYLSILKDRRLKRLMRTSFHQHTQKLSTEDDARDVMASLQFDISGMQEEYEHRVSPEEIVERIGLKYQAASEVGYTGIPSRWPQLQAILGGYQHGKVYPIASRPKTGKTTLGCNEALAAAQKGFGVLFISTEMKEEQLRAKMIGDELGLDLFRFLQGQASKEEIACFVECGRRQAKLPIKIVDGNQTIDTVRTMMMDHCRDYKMCVIDYMQNLADSQNDPKRTLEKLERGSQVLTHTAGDTDMATLALLQLNRAAEIDERGKRILPLVKHIKGTGSYEQDAQAIVLLARHKSMPGDDEYDDDQPTVLRVAYNRSGPTGRLDFNFKKSEQRLEPGLMQGF